MENSSELLCMTLNFEHEQHQHQSFLNSLNCSNIVAETAMSMTASRARTTSFDNNSLRLHYDEGENDTSKYNNNSTNQHNVTPIKSLDTPRRRSSSVSSSTSFIAAAEPRGSVSPSTIVSCPRRLKSVLVTQDYDPDRARPELESILRGRPQFKLPPETVLFLETATTTAPSLVPAVIRTAMHRKKQSVKDKLVSVASDESKENKVVRKSDTASVGKRIPNGIHQRPSVVTPTSSEVEESDSTDEANDNESPTITWTQNPPPLRMQAWSDTQAREFKVRGPTYFQNGVKVLSESSVLQCFAADLVHVAEPLWKTGMSRHPEERIQRALVREKETGVPQLPAFVFLVNLLLPAASGGFYHFVAYFGTHDTKVLTDPSTPFGRLAKPFFFGNDDEFRNRCFKFIPRVTEGNFLVRSAVGGKPTLLGRKLKLNFTRNERFMEVLVDISSNQVASRVVKLALGYAKTLAVDLMFLLEGDTKETIPERILGGVRIQNIDFGKQDGRPTSSPVVSGFSC